MKRESPITCLKLNSIKREGMTGGGHMDLVTVGLYLRHHEDGKPDTIRNSGADSSRQEPFGGLKIEARSYSDLRQDRPEAPWCAFEFWWDAYKPGAEIVARLHKWSQKLVKALERERAANGHFGGSAASFARYLLTIAKAAGCTSIVEGDTNTGWLNEGTYRFLPLGHGVETIAQLMREHRPESAPKLEEQKSA